MAIPACLSPKWREKLKKGQQYNVQTFTSAPIQAFAQLRLSCPIHVFSGVTLRTLDPFHEVG